MTTYSPTTGTCAKGFNCSPPLLLWTGTIFLSTAQAGAKVVAPRVHMPAVGFSHSRILQAGRLDLLASGFYSLPWTPWVLVRRFVLSH